MTEPLLAMWAAGVRAVEPERLLAGAQVEAGALFLDGTLLGQGQTLHAVCLGKAACGLAWGLERALRGQPGLRVLFGVDIDAAPVGWLALEGDHPIPSQRNVEHTQTVLRALADLPPEDLVIVAISGGASALLTAPRVALDRLQALTRDWLNRELPIEHINAGRCFLDSAKAGGLAGATTARVVTLLLSDVSGEPFAIGSGPTLPWPVDAIEPGRALTAHIDEARAPAPVKPGPWRLLGHRQTAVDGALAQGRALGLDPRPGPALHGDASAMAEALLQLEPGLWVCAGETTVQVRGGRGGRNQHLALAAAIAGQGTDFELLCAGTDGIDGPTDVAGARVDGTTVRRLHQHGLDPRALLDDTDSYTAFQALGDHIRTGPTGTNVSDLAIVRIG